jgi:hypothetical protein
VALIGAVVLVGIFAPQVDDWAWWRAGTDPIGAAAEHVAREHRRYARSTDRASASSNTHQSASVAAAAIAEHLGLERAVVFDLSALGYEFVGENLAGVPGTDPSVQLRYRRNADGPPACVSVFIVANRSHQLGCPIYGGRNPGKWHACGSTVLRAVDDSCVYFLASCDPGDVDAVAAAIQQAIAASAGK